MAQLGILHYIYVIMVLIVLVTMAFKKDVVLPCIAGIFIMGVASTGSLLKGIQVIYNTLIAAGTEFWGIIVIISCCSHVKSIKGYRC